MQQEDIETIERLCAKYKLRYTDMGECFKETIAGSYIYVPINLGNCLKELYEFKETLIDEKDFEIHACISILNIFGHYKHFFKINDARHVIILAYVKDNYIYDMYNKVMDGLVEFCNFFPNIYTIPKILLDNRLYVHVVAALMQYMNKMSPKPNHSNVYVISNQIIDRQLMCIFPTFTSYTLSKTYNGMPSFMTKTDYIKHLMKHPEYYDGTPYKGEYEYMNIFISKYFNTLPTLSKKLYRKDGGTVRYKHQQIKDKYELMNKFFMSVYNPSSNINMAAQAFMYLQSEGEFKDIESKDVFMVYEKIYDFRFQNIGELNEIIIPLLSSWKHKIKDYEIARQSESYKTLIDHNLSTNWLLQ